MNNYNHFRTYVELCNVILFGPPPSPIYCKTQKMKETDKTSHGFKLPTFK